MQYLKIPNERIGVLIGEKGSLKREIEKRTNTKIEIEDTSVTVDSTSTDSFGELSAKNIVLAIGRGFNPEIALKLLNEDYNIEVIPLTDYFNSPNAYERVKGRVIGKSGKSRKVIEELSGAFICVYGKTISIIGSFDDVALAKDAVIMLIEGARHTSVYRMLEKAQSQRKSMSWGGELPPRRAESDDGLDEEDDEKTGESEEE